MTAELVLGIDIGSSRVKAAAWTAAGNCVAAGAVPTPRVITDGGTDLPVAALLDAACDAVRALRTELAAVAAVGVATMGEVGTVLRGGTLVDLAFPAWFDDRGSDVVRDLVAVAGHRHLTGRTGRAPRPTTSVAKLGWLHRRGVDLSGTFLGIGAALVFRLTGAVTQEASLAATSGAFDPFERRYDDEVWAAAGLGDVVLPRVRARTEPAPHTGGPVARAVGLRAGLPVVLAGHDHPVAALGTGARPGEVVDSMGTGEPLLTTWGTPPGPWPHRRDEVAALVTRGLTVTVWPSTGHPALMWEDVRPGLAMERLAALLGRDRALLDADCPPPGEVAPLAADVVRALEDGEPPRDVGLRTWAALLDHYALRVAHGDRVLRATTGALGATLLTGGGLRSPRWRAAKVWARPPDCPWALQTSGATETVARGAAALAGVEVGWWATTAEMPGADRSTLDEPRATR